MRILADEDEITKAQCGFKEAVTKAASRKIKTKIGHRGRDRTVSVYWVRAADLWACFDWVYGEKRYLNLFGLGKPSASVSIACEINTPIRGIDRKIAGAFAEDRGEIYLLHRGKFTAHGGITKKFVYENFMGTCISASDDDQNSKFLRVGKLSAPRFVDDLHKFVTEVVRVKAHRRDLSAP